MAQQSQTKAFANTQIDLASTEAVGTMFRQVRQQTEELCAPLAVEDFGVQSMPDASPTKWHLAHTTWFFETFVLSRFAEGFRRFHPRYDFLFNSYYNTIGERVPRPNRGLLSRPTVEEVFQYRHSVDVQICDLLEGLTENRKTILRLIVLGLHHEQQHQELILTDIKHAFSYNPLRPVYRDTDGPEETAIEPLQWLEFSGGVHRIGFDGDGFSFDNESPQHNTFAEDFSLASRLVTNEEFLEFQAEDGYDRPDLWLSDGWIARQHHGWDTPAYWEKRDGNWWQMTLAGMRPVVASEPVCHVSFYEADAFARWSHARLPTEAEWEIAALTRTIDGNFLESGHFHPTVAHEFSGQELRQMFGDVWEWTASPYIAYPGYSPPNGALGEYNGKFMCNQFVCRGGSCATPISHIRPTYRNFFPPDARWQFFGFRLAK